MIYVLIGLALLVVLLAAGGFVAQQRRLKASEAEFRAQLAKADRDLAAALAQDQGWEYSRLETAARAAFAAAHPGLDIDQLDLIEVTDRPGKDQDRATFRVVADGRPEHVEIARHGDQWGAGQEPG
jgi:hypothetical protein